MASTGRTEHTPSQANFELIVSALGDYANLTGINLSKHPFSEKLLVSRSPDDILGLLEEREKAFKEYREGNRRIISYLSPLVRVIHTFSSILGEAVALAPFPPAKAIFVGLDVLLAAATGVSSSYDSLLDLFECLTSFLKRLEIYTKIPPTPVMIDIIVKIMAELLSVLALATKQIHQGRFKKFARKLMGESEVEAVLQRLDRLTQDEARMTVAQTLGVVHELINNMKVVMDDGNVSTSGIRQTLVVLHEVVIGMNKLKRDQLQQEIQRWLSPPDPSTNHDFVSKARHKGTAAWFFEGNVLAEWKSKGSLLWIHGKPGSGKSTLLSAIIQDIEDMCAAGLASMAYYYFDFRDVKKQNIYGLLSCLLSQLSVELDSCHNFLSRSHSVNAGGARKPTSLALTGYIKDVLTLPGQSPIYIVIDALDECPNVSGTPSAREEVLELIEELVDLNLSNVYLCVTSRPEIDIRMVLDPLKPLQISLHDERGQKQDIVEYIRSIVHSDRRMRRWREEDQKLVIDTLSERADGMFRWVVCQIDRLRRNFPPSIRGALAELPESLDQTYEQTLLGIDKEKRRYAQRLFRCLSVSIRPLRVEEFAEILAVRFDAAGSSTFDTDWRPVDAEEAVLSACSSLIAIVNVDDSLVVQFSHFSVKEFLTSDRLATADELLSYYHILPEPAHITLASSCLSTLLQLDEKIDRNTIRHFPLSKYAAQYWTDHAQFENVASCVQDLMVRLFDQAKPHFAAWIWLYDIDRHWVRPMPDVHPQVPEAVPLYYASLCGFRGLVEHLIAVHPPHVNSEGGLHATPLHAASVGGHSEVAQLLLNNNAAPDSHSIGGGTPLHIASRYGHLEIVKMLLVRGADVNRKRKDGETPLHLASAKRKFQAAHWLVQRVGVVDVRCGGQQTPLNGVAGRGSSDIVRLLIDSGANATIADDKGWTPLHAAAQQGNRDIAELLLLSGADPDARNNAQETPLDMACHYGNLAVSRLLLDRGSDLTCQDKQGWTPLHSASRYGHVDVTELLLDRGADVNAQKADRGTPLHLASYIGHLDIAQLLITHGADVDSRNDKEETPLDRASWHGHLNIARFLIGRGAAISPTDNKGWTPFHSASKRGHFHVAKFLLECGVDVDIRNGNQETSLDLASSNGNLDVVRFLVGQGADIHAMDNKGWNPLHIASKCGHLHVVKYLLECGVGVDIRNGNQETPLDLASNKGKLDVVRFLVEQGADIHTRDNKSWNPLHIASKFGHLHVVKFLLECGVDVDIRNGNQETPLDLASGTGELDVVRFLVGKGADIHTRDNKNWNPLHIASRDGHLDVVQLLVDAGANVDIRNGKQKTPLALASNGGEIEVSRFLIERGADTNTRDNVGWGPLHFASRQGHVEMVRLLLDCGVDPNIRHDNLESPLHLASANGYLKVTRLLVQRGARLDLFDDKQQTPLDKAAGNGKIEVVRFLIDHGVNLHTADSHGWTPLHASSRSGHLEIVKLLLRRGMDMGVLDKENKTAAELASENDKPEVASFLAEYREDPNVRNKVRSKTVDTPQLGADEDGKDEGRASLHTMSREGKVKVVKFLLDQGADINSRDHLNETPLHEAATKGHLAVALLLTERGAEVDSRDNSGWTPLHDASRYGHVEVSRMLLDHGANVNARQQNYWTPLHLSARNGHTEVVKLLLERDADVHVLNDEGETPHQLSIRNGYFLIEDMLKGHGAGG